MLDQSIFDTWTCLTNSLGFCMFHSSFKGDKTKNTNFMVEII